MRVPDALLVHLRRARDLADRHYAEPLDLDGLAAAGVSKYHFLRCFTATYGKTPALYLADRSRGPAGHAGAGVSFGLRTPFSTFWAC